MFTIRNGNILMLDGKPYGKVTSYDPSPTIFGIAVAACKVRGEVLRVSGTVFSMLDTDGELHFWRKI